MKKILSLIILLFLASCTTEIPTTQFQEWGEYSFRLESRPPVIKEGMNEFLFVGNFKDRFRAFDLIVSFRIGESGKWNQAIQDGHTGVYRRAMMVRDVSKDILFVRVKQNKNKMMSDEPKEDEVFQFPLNYSSSPESKSGT